MEKTEENLISIIIPVYNAEKYIAKCIDSVLKQDYRKFEIILVNDGSSEPCTSLLRRLAEKDTCIKLIEQNNEGVSNARNNGLQNCSGEWVVFIDADDYIEENFLSVMLTTAQRCSADIVISEYFTCSGARKLPSKFLNDTTIKSYSKEQKIDLIKSCIEARAFGNTEGVTNIGVPWAKLYNRKVILGNKFDSKLTHMEDMVFNINVFMKACNIVYIPEALYNYRIHMESAVHSIQKNFEPVAQRVIDCLYEFEEQYQFEKELEETIKYKEFCLYYQCIKTQYIRNPEFGAKEVISNMRRIARNYTWNGKMEKSIYRFCTKYQKIYGILAKFNCYELLYFALKIAEYKR